MSRVQSLGRHPKGRFYSHVGRKAQRVESEGPQFAGWEIYHINGSPVNPDRLYASQTSGWFGQVIQRSSDGGKTWERREVVRRIERRGWMTKGESNKFDYVGDPGTHCGTTAHSTRGNSSASGC